MSVVDLEALEVVANAVVGREATHVAVRPQPDDVYAVASGEGVVAVIDPATLDVDDVVVGAVLALASLADVLTELAGVERSCNRDGRDSRPIIAKDALTYGKAAA